MKNEYFRKFITLSHENEQRSKTFGTFVAERRETVNKITLSISNIRPNVSYCLTLVKVFDSSAKFIDICTFESDDLGTVSIKKEVQQKVLQNIELDEFDVCIIRINSSELITPLVGYFNNKVKWREYYVHAEEKVIETTTVKKHTLNVEDEQVVTKPYEFGFNSQKSNVIVEAHSKDFKVVNNYHLRNNKPLSDSKLKVKKYTIKNQASEKPETMVNPTEIRYNPEDSDLTIKKLKEEIENLKNIATSSYSHTTKCAYEDIHTLPYTIDNIFDTGSSIVPFRNNNHDINWVIVDYTDLVIIDKNMEFVKNPFIRNSYKKFSHFILGKYIEAEKPVYMIGVPDFFNHEFENDIRNLGFISYKEAVGGLAQGYWLLLIQ